MVLSDRELRLRLPDIIKPYEPALIQPASIDVRLGTSFLVPDESSITHVDLENPPTKLMRAVDLAEAEDPGVRNSLTIHPGEFVLGSTKEIVSVPDDLACSLMGRSSIGRLGLQVHATAGWIDPGFHGSVTLEMFNELRVPIVVRPGLVIAQLAFQMLTSAAEQPYSGRYQNDMVATASRLVQ